MANKNPRRQEESLWNAVALNVVAWRETEAMFVELSALFEAEIPRRIRATLKTGNNKEQYVPGDWVYVAYLHQWGLVPIGKRKPFGWLCATAALGSPGRDGADMLLGKTPSLTVCYCPGETEWKDALSADDPAALTEWKNLGLAAEGRLIVEEPQRWKKKVAYDEQGSGWCFCLPLFVLDTARDLKVHVVNPVTSLLAGQKPESALGSHPHVLRFREDDGVLSLREPLPGEK